MSDAAQWRELADGVFTLTPFLHAAECAALIAQTERAGYEAATIATERGAVRDEDVRNNARFIMDDPARAAALWQSLREHVPPFLSGRQAIGVNERFRFYRYDPGERFAGHIDAPFRRANGEQSLLTFMVYLNADFDGGETTFRELVVRPRTGMALLFRHDIFHEGAAVRRGRKYVQRSDIMFNPPGRVTMA
jgi:predicted 2-oxoglutarate/Fe(II)-dependent dioxygenase YbiX